MRTWNYLFITFEKLAHNEIYKYNQDDPRFLKTTSND
ncbi:hypothetical protein P344_02825 [Spiroplasma mirum ATCC 29335]|uniref:Uncharacterized protein n=1 Tax=Spiroplasma mirum ATCC 29335 TaxID=838561 RepID=W6AMG0_9MOLU|nr:hypothetical protein P344_02825 [Spiroplasma mirum ATCC 29335]